MTHSRKKNILAAALALIQIVQYGTTVVNASEVSLAVREVKALIANEGLLSKVIGDGPARSRLAGLLGVKPQEISTLSAARAKITSALSQQTASQEQIVSFLNSKKIDFDKVASQSATTLSQSGGTSKVSALFGDSSGTRVKPSTEVINLEVIVKNSQVTGQTEFFRTIRQNPTLIGSGIKKDCADLSQTQLQTLVNVVNAGGTKSGEALVASMSDQLAVDVSIETVAARGRICELASAPCNYFGPSVISACQ